MMSEAVARDDFAPPRGGAMDLRELIAVLLAGWRWIAISFLAAVGLAVAYLVLATPLYRSDTTLFIDPRLGTGLNTDIAAYRLAAETGLIDSQVKLISSDAVLRRVVESEGLASDIEFVGATQGPEAIEKAMRSLGERLQVVRSERTFVVDISVASANPKKAAHLSDAVAQAYIADQMDAKAAVSRYESQWVKDRLGELQARILDAEKRVEVFKDMNRIVGANGKLMNEQQLADANTQLAQARVRTAEAKSKVDQVESIIASGREPDAIPDAIRSGTIERLRTQYAEGARDLANLRQTMGPRHPAYRAGEQQITETRRLITQELRRIAESTRNELKVAEANEAALQKRVELLSREAGSTNQSLVRLRELEREVEAQRSTYERFLRTNGTVAQESVDTPPARIVAPAVVPIRPTSPRRMPILMIAAATGLGLGAAGALFDAERRRNGRPNPIRPAPAGPAPTPPAAPSPANPPSSPPPARPPLPPADRASSSFAPAVARSASATSQLSPAPPLTPPTKTQAPGSGDGASLAPAVENALERVRFVPRLPKAEGRTGEASGEPPSQPVEKWSGAEYAAFVADLRETLEARREREQPLLVLVTSADPESGKTTLARHLALSFARAGRRTLLVDANWRRPALARLMARDAIAAVARIEGVRRPILAFGASWHPNLELLPLGEGGEIEAFARAFGQARPLAATETVIVDTSDLAGDESLERLLERASLTVVLAPIATSDAAPSPHFAVAVLRDRKAAEDAVPALRVPA